jgi:anti-sigma factor RsiW
MNCQACHEKMGELADARLDAATAASVRAHIDGCAECRTEFESLSRTLRALDALPAAAPSHRLRARVMGHIESEKLTQREGAEWASSIRRAAMAPPERAFPWARTLAGLLGACALVALGFMVGERSATQGQVADLRARVDTMGELVQQSVLHKEATGDRIQTVFATSNEKPDSQVIEGLINTMAFDPSANVRLSALSALYPHADQEVVRAAVLACLPRDPNPLVQVSMIDFLVATKTREAQPVLRKLVVDTTANTDVKESARLAIDQL